VLVEATARRAGLVEEVLPSGNDISDSLLNDGVVQILLGQDESEHVLEHLFGLEEEVLEPEHEDGHFRGLGQVHPVVVPLFPDLDVGVEPLVPVWLDLGVLHVLPERLSMRLGGDHVEEAQGDVEWVSDGQDHHLGVVLRVEGSAEGVVGLVDPAAVLDYALALEARVLQGNVQTELHQLVASCGHAGDVLEVLPQEGVARTGVARVGDGIYWGSLQELGLPIKEIHPILLVIQ